MNLNNLRKNYDTLSFRERYSLYQMASVRRDESEINAVVLASPKSNYTQVDFAFFDEKVLILQLENIFERLDHSIRFDLFLNARDKTDENSRTAFSLRVIYTPSKRTRGKPSAMSLGLMSKVFGKEWRRIICQSE